MQADKHSLAQDDIASSVMLGTPGLWRPIIGRTVDILPTGSRVIPGCATEYSDYDYVCLLYSDDTLEEAMDFLTNLGFILGGGEHYREQIAENKFLSFTRGQINLIVVKDPAFFERWKLATVGAIAIADHLRLQGREGRKNFFKTILYS